MSLEPLEWDNFSAYTGCAYRNLTERKIMRGAKLAACLGLAWGAAQWAHAQPGWRGGWGGGWGGGYFSSTPAEGYARGLADMVRSAGQANLSNSEAAINYEQARAANFDNRLKYTQMWFERRRLNDEYTQQQRAERRYSREMFRGGGQRPPDPLTAAELDPLTGQINWPSSLMLEAFAGSRERFQELSTQRVKDGHTLDFEAQNAVRSEARTMTDELRDQIASYTPNDYAAARRFIQRLSAELRSS